MERSRISPLGLWTALLLMCACGARESGAPQGLMKYADTNPALEARASGGAESPSPAGSESVLRAGRMVIKTADLSIQVEKYDGTLEKIQQITNRNSGYVVASSASADDAGRKSGSVTLRVPSPKFNQTLDELKKTASKVESESIQGQDVTEEFYDLAARLDNKKRAETRFQEILQSAQNAKEILEVEQALAAVREEIDRLEARKRYVQDHVAMSTITVYLPEPVPFAGSGSTGFWARMARGFQRGVNGFADVIAFLITLIIASVPVLALAAVLVLLIRKVKKTALFPLKSRKRTNK